MGQFVELRTFEHFEQLAQGSKRVPILLSVYRDGCPDCLSPEAEEAIESVYASKAKLVKISADNAPEIESMLNIDLVPTLWLRTAKGARKFISIPDVDGKNVLAWLAEQIPPLEQGVTRQVWASLERR